jgi:hypothetical protein
MLMLLCGWRFRTPLSHCTVKTFGPEATTRPRIQPLLFPDAHQ